jgi:hypothetical protein
LTDQDIPKKRVRAQRRIRGLLHPPPLPPSKWLLTLRRTLLLLLSHSATNLLLPSHSATNLLLLSHSCNQATPTAITLGNQPPTPPLSPPQSTTPPSPRPPPLPPLPSPSPRRSRACYNASRFGNLLAAGGTQARAAAAAVAVDTLPLGENSKEKRAYTRRSDHVPGEASMYPSEAHEHVTMRNHARVHALQQCPTTPTVPNHTNYRRV